MIENPSPRAKLLHVDDDAKLRGLVSDYMMRHGFRIEGAGSVGEAERLQRRNRYDLMLLDIMLPGEDGVSFCRRLRAQSPGLPIIILSARGEDVDRIVGLEVGADDYLPKPFNLRELVARVLSVLRRSEHGRARTGSSPGEAHRFGEFELDLWDRRLRKGDITVDLSTSEYELLAAFAANARRVMSRDELASCIAGHDREALSRGVDMTVSRLRKLVEPDVANPRYIQTIWGRGYMFVPDRN
jgi:two-component system phosphate regulon response regulator OmpR